jgi:NADH-quinone oxidoreductase subunit J
MPASPEAGAYVVFGFLACAVVGLALMMLFSRNFVHSAVYLAGSLLGFAGLNALLNATFLALLQVFIYAGAITVVVVFVVMMTRVGVETRAQLMQPRAWTAALVIALIGAGLLGALAGFAPLLRAPVAAVTTPAIAEGLLGPYAAAFEISSLILLASLVGAIYLSKEARP